MKKQILYIAGLLVFVLTLLGCKSALSTANFSTESEVKKITIEEIACDIEILPTDDSILSMEYSELKEKYTYVITMNNQTGSLVIKRKDNRKGFAKESFTNQARTTIYIPNDFEVELDIDCNAGSINIDDVNTKDIAIDLNAGDVKIRNIKSENKIDIKVQFGDITLNNVDTTELSCDLNAGNYEIQSCNFSEKMTIKGYAGDAELSDVKSPNNNIEITNGDVEYYYVEVLKTLNITVTTGDINISLTGKKADYTLTKNVMGTTETVGSGSLIVNLSITVGRAEVTYLK